MPSLAGVSWNQVFCREVAAVRKGVPPRPPHPTLPQACEMPLAPLPQGCRGWRGYHADLSNDREPAVQEPPQSPAAPTLPPPPSFRWAGAFPVFFFFSSSSSFPISSQV